MAYRSARHTLDDGDNVDIERWKYNEYWIRNSLVDAEFNESEGVADNLNIPVRSQLSGEDAQLFICNGNRIV